MYYDKELDRFVKRKQTMTGHIGKYGMIVGLKARGITLTIKEVLEKIEKELIKQEECKATTELGFVVNLKFGGVTYAFKTSRENLTGCQNNS